VKTFKTKILLAGIITVFAFIVTIGTTYAWFTVGQNSAISAIQLRVESDTSLLILLDNGYIYDAEHDKVMLDNPSSYSSILNNSDFTGIYDFGNITMLPVTTLDGKAFLKSDRVTSASYSDNIATPGQYLQFSMWLLSQDNTVTVALKDLTVTATTGSFWQNTVTDAVRLSTTVGANDAQIYGFDKDYDFEFLPGQTGYDSVTAANNIINSGYETALTALHELSYQSSGTPDEVESTATLASAATVVQLTTNIPQMVTVRIWIEGWDFDCTNNILGATFSFAFDFTVKAVVV
jgi:hypothetical protein